MHAQTKRGSKQVHASQSTRDGYIVHAYPEAARVHLNGGNRSGQTGTKPAQIQNLNLNSKKNEKFPKNPKNTSRCVESNGVKFSQKFVYLVYFAGI